MIRGQRFNIDLDKDELELDDPIAPAAPLPFVADVLERTPKTPAPPSAPSLKSKTGFPEHRKRSAGSRFKQKQAAASGTLSTSQHELDSTKRAPQAATPTASTHTSAPMSFEDQQRDQIDQQNRDVLAGMSEAEIQEARRELLGTLDPDLLQKLLRRSHIDSGSNEAESLQPPSEPVEGGSLRRGKPVKPKSVAFADSAPAEASQDDPPKPSYEEPALVYEHEPNFRDAQDDPPEHLHNHPHTHQDESVHFPTPAQPPPLDPNSPNFLTDLHEKYFPNLPADPSALDWMRNTPKDSYSPTADALNPNEIRFDFTGSLLPPRTSASIPVSAGLHHHGDAPDSAGYTIPELAHLSRSTYAAQRCIAFQTVGRILFRLGRGEFGDPGEPGQNLVGAEETMGELARGLWREAEREKVVEQLVAESEGNGIDGGRHVSAKAYATEAVWLWQRGGGRRWKAD